MKKSKRDTSRAATAGSLIAKRSTVNVTSKVLLAQTCASATTVSMTRIAMCTAKSPVKS